VSAGEKEEGVMKGERNFFSTQLCLSLFLADAREKKRKRGGGRVKKGGGEKTKDRFF